jgi:hypothetical protein
MDAQRVPAAAEMRQQAARQEDALLALGEARAQPNDPATVDDRIALAVAALQRRAQVRQTLRKAEPTVLAGNLHAECSQLSQSFDYVARVCAPFIDRRRIHALDEKCLDAVVEPPEFRALGRLFGKWTD